MAITKTIVLKVDSKAGVKNVDALGDSIVDTKNDIINLERELLKLEKQLAKTNARDFKGRKKLNDTIQKTKTAIQEEKLALKSLTVQRGAARTAARAQLKANKGLNKSYFESKESLTDVNRLTAEFALKVKAVRNIFVGAIQKVKEFAKAQKLAFTAGVIGIFLLALAAVLAFWSEISEVVTGVNKKLQKQADLSQRVLDLTEGRLKTLQLEQKLLEAQGKSISDNIELQKTQLRLQLLENALLIDSLETINEKANARALELSFGQQIAAFGRGGKGFDAVGTENEKERLAREEREDVIKDLRDNQITAGTSLTALLNPEAGKGAGDDGKRDPITGLKAPSNKSIQEEELRVFKEFGDKKFELIQSQNQAKIDEEIEFLRQKNALGVKTLEEEKDREQALADFKVNTAKGTLNLIGAIAKEGSAVAKGYQVAQATISGIEGVQAAFSTAAKSPITTFFPPYPFIQAGIAGAFSAVQIQKILSVKPGSSGTAQFSGGGGSGGGATPAPAFNLVAGSGTNQIAEGLSQQPTPLRAFVVSSEQTTAAAIDRNIVDNASL